MSFDGKNLDVILLEFGVRIHRVLYEHILTFTVNSIGAMFLICDMNEYRKSIKEFGNTYLNEIFDNLQTLCNLFIVMPENLKQVCTEEPYVSKIM
jgi:recyclin-1